MTRSSMWSLQPAPSSGAWVTYFAVDGIGRQDTALAVETALRQLPGVWLVAVYGEAAMVAVAYDPKEVSQGFLQAVVKAAGAQTAQTLRVGLMYTRPLNGGGLWV